MTLLKPTIPRDDSDYPWVELPAEVVESTSSDFYEADRREKLALSQALFDLDDHKRLMIEAAMIRRGAQDKRGKAEAEQKGKAA